MYFDPYVSKNSPLHRFDARAKLPLTVAYILTLALFPQITLPIFLIMFGLLIAAAVLSEIEAHILLKRVLWASPFILAALPLPFTTPGVEVFQISFGSLHLAGSQAGLMRLLSIALKFWLSVGAAVLLSTTTPMNELLIAMRALRVPRLLVAIIGMMWRYLGVLVNEARRLITARNARSAGGISDTRSGGRLIWRAQVTGGMAGSLLLRSFDRSDRVYAAMLARGYNGEIKSFTHKKLDATSRKILAAGLLFFVILLIIENFARI